MKLFFKAQLSSLLATGMDFIITIFVVEALHFHYIAGIILGAAMGAVTNFVINRYWSFKASSKPLKKQSFRYGMVWVGSLLLNVAGVYLLTHFGAVKYIISKVIVAVIVGISFNYTLQKKYVFDTNENYTS